MSPEGQPSLLRGIRNSRVSKTALCRPPGHSATGLSSVQVLPGQLVLRPASLASVRQGLSAILQGTLVLVGGCTNELRALELSLYSWKESPWGRKWVSG